MKYYRPYEMTPILDVEKKIWNALHNGEMETATSIIDNYLDQNEDVSIKQLLQIACDIGSKELIEYLMLTEKFTVESEGYFLLNCAVKKGHGKVVQYLIEKGLDIHKRDKFGKTPLDYAQMNKHYNVVHILINNGAA